MEGNRMKERLGNRKVVYRDGTYVKVVEGSCYSMEHFVRVKTETGDVYINKDAVVVIKNR